MNKYQEMYKELCRRNEYFKSTEQKVNIGKINMDLIKELVDKSTPKKPILFDTGFYFNNTNDKSLMPLCPSCKQPLRQGRCCDDNNCRQAIDWSKKR